MVAIMSFASEYFFSWRNFEAILFGADGGGTIAVGMAILLVSGGLDLSVGSTLALSGVITGKALVSGVPILLSISAGLLVCLLVGLVNGFSFQSFG
jgi:ribose/xylose/arabinose/galactoside ABC-type transport system permease subunit